MQNQNIVNLMTDTGSRKMIDGTIHVVQRDVYGTPKTYPNCERSRLIARMLGQKTLTPTDIVFIEMLGFTVEGK